MFSRNTGLVWIGLILLSGMFLMGQEGWSQSDPQIGSVIPDPAQAGAEITINGSGFGGSQGASQLLYDGDALAIVSWSDTQIEATLPDPKPDGTYGVQVFVDGIGSNTVQHTISAGASKWGSMIWGDDNWGN